MLKELVQSYPGLLDYRLESHIGFVKFSSHEDAEVALAGKPLMVTCHRPSQVQTRR